MHQAGSVCIHALFVDWPIGNCTWLYVMCPRPSDNNHVLSLQARNVNNVLDHVDDIHW